MSSIQELVNALAEQLRAKNYTLSTAESCTGGLLGSAMTSQSGSSAWYSGGCVTYTNALKTELIGVRETTIQQHGAVSEDVAREMCLGVSNVCATDVSLSTTGIAGPTGGSEAKPVGTVCIGCNVRSHVTLSTFHFEGDREQVREQSVSAALLMCLDSLKGHKCD